MPFKKYKAEHGGRGPIEDLYAKATGGVGLFGTLGLRQERELTDELIAEVSSNEELSGLAGMVEIGRSPLTREQHAQFRAGITQAAINMQAFNAGMSEFATRMGDARGTAVSKEDNQILDNFQALANHAQRLSATGNTGKAEEIFGNVLENFGAYIARNEEQRLEVESAEAAGRETMRSEMQGQLNSLRASATEDQALFRSIMAQMEGIAGDEVLPPSLVSAGLEFAGAALRQSDDGNWSLGIGPLGISDTNLPAMTASQLRNRMNAAYRGRQEVLNGAAQTLVDAGKLRGMGVNGSNIDDLYFPLASQVFQQRERETKPPSLTDPGRAGELSKRITETISNVGEGFFPNFVEGASRGLEWLLGMPEEPHITPGDTRQGPGSVSGVIQRRPVND